jgi:hypothetical protein
MIGNEWMCDDGCRDDVFLASSKELPLDRRCKMILVALNSLVASTCTCISGRCSISDFGDEGMSCCRRESL